MATVKEYSVEEKLAALLNLQKVESKLDAIAILKGELPIEVRDLEDEIQGLHSRETRMEEEINGINEFIEQKKQTIVQSSELIKKYEKQSDKNKVKISHSSGKILIIAPDKGSNRFPFFNYGKKNDEQVSDALKGVHTMNDFIIFFVHNNKLFVLF